MIAALVLIPALLVGQDSEMPVVLDRPPGNSIGDMSVGADSTLWIAAGGGVAKSPDFGETWIQYSGENTENFPRGTVSAMRVRGDTVWVATVFDTSTTAGDLDAGGGLARSFDGGESWTYLPQPTESPEDSVVAYGDTVVTLNPTTTNVQNITYDLAFRDSIVWVASWGGGIQKSTDYGQTWRRIPTPMDNMESLSPESVPPDYEIRLVPGDNRSGNENQKGFSVAMRGEHVWVGTSGGVNHSTDGGQTWRRYHFDNSRMSGNWVLALHLQDTGENTYLWASTGQTVQGQQSGISVYNYNKDLWRTAKTVRFANNFAHRPATHEVYAATDAGIFKTADFGYSWEPFGTIYDEETGEPVYGSSGSRGIFYAISALIGPSPDGERDRLWIGTTDGLAYTDNEYEWQVLRAFQPTSSPEVENIYVYPNPFSPSRHNQLEGDGHVRIQYDMRASGTVTVRVFDFAMDKVADVVVEKSRPEGSFSEAWNGRNRLGDIVANGVYFCKVTLQENGDKRTHWTKLLVID